MVKGRLWVFAAAMAASGVAGGAVVLTDRSGGPVARRPTLSSPMSIGGVVFVDADGDGEMRSGEVPISNAAVKVSAPLAGTEADLTTDANGAFVAQIGAIASVRVSVTLVLPPPDGAAVDIPIRLERDVAAGEVIEVPVRPVARSCPTLEACPDLLVPDLVPFNRLPSFLNDEMQREYPGPDKWYIDTTTSPGRRLLRVATISANVGRGPLLILGTDKRGDEFTGTVQRVLDSAAGFADFRAGDFELSASHEHVHLDSFEQIRLVAPSGAVAAARKISFCLTDVFPVEVGARAARSVAVALGLFDCGVEQQGINSGMADYYGPALPDQFVDVTDVAAGDYQLEIEVDPDRMIVEADEANNVVRLPVVLP